VSSWPGPKAEPEPETIELSEAPDWLTIGAVEVWNETAVLMIAENTW
jgi:phage terminase small subunit